MKCENYVKLSFPALSRNESYARAAVGAFVSQLDPTVDELGSVKAAVSEAVTNAIVHGYRQSFFRMVTVVPCPGVLRT